MKRSAACPALAVLAALVAGCGPAREQTWADRDETLGELLAARAELSLYEGAPPVISHEVAALGRDRCANCHAPGAYDNGDRVASPRPHPAWGDCRQCHIERRGAGVFQPSLFKPLRWQPLGDRQSGIAPPMIPHHIQNREHCAICHIGAQAHPALRSAHAYRPQCRQCHVRMVR